MILTHCPTCNKELVRKIATPILYTLRCIDHYVCTVKEEIVIEEVLIVENKAFTFDYKFKVINYFNDLPGVLYKIIPWFEPDFSDIDKLISKLRTYLVLL